MKKLEVSLCTVPMLGHLMPLLPYAAELLRRGHAVTIFHEGNPKYRRLIEQCGLDACESVVYNSPSQLQSDGLYESLQSHYHNKNKPGVVVYDFFAVDAADAADVTPSGGGLSQSPLHQSVGGNQRTTSEPVMVSMVPDGVYRHGGGSGTALVVSARSYTMVALAAHFA